jgi:hypothetical protein
MRERARDVTDAWEPMGPDGPLNVAAPAQPKLSTHGSPSIEQTRNLQKRKHSLNQHSGAKDCLSEDKFFRLYDYTPDTLRRFHQRPKMKKWRKPLREPAWQPFIENSIKLVKELR